MVTAPRTTRHDATADPERGTRTSRRTGERQDAHARIHFGKLLGQESDRETIYRN
jgi:hypothetical protein